MAVDNTTIGSVLTIPSDLISKLDKVDAKIKKIQESSRATATTFNTQFAGMTSNTNFLINNLDRIIGQLGTIGGAAQTASQATQGIGQGMGAASQGATNFGNSITSVIQAINQMLGQLQQTGQIGTSSLMAAKLAADKLMEAMQYKNSGNIAALKYEIQNINNLLKNTEVVLSRSNQQALVERKRLLQEELKEAERTQNERAVNLQRVLDRMAKAEQSYHRQVAQAQKRTAEEYKAQNYASNTTYQGSLNFAENANTINRRTQAVKYLTEARNALSKTDSEYSSKLEKLNAKIKELNAANKQAIASSQELSNKHRNLMDTAGQLQRAFALLFSVSQIRGYIGQIAKVRGEFELQQRSLESILQNKTKADEIFNKTVALAVQSPYQIKDLISYTKQLAAYRIESDKLYDTTKRLADVSAGLGVDMQRLILAYGQVKAAAYLRGCLGYNTPIRMYDGGIKMVQDVAVGDVLINEKGEKVNVKELIRGREQMYIVRQSDGLDYRVNENHILTLYKDGCLHDIYVREYNSEYLGARYVDGKLNYGAMSIEKDVVDDYFGFVLDGNKRFQLGDGTITHNTEVRQFTEAGINLYGELQAYFKEVKGEAYTTAQIVDMISKRMVTFEDVEQIFKRITDQGGIFYRMQEIQAETLQGKIANLKDSVDVMLNEIGKDNEGLFKGAIDSATALFGHWETVVNVGKDLVGVLIAMKLQSALTNKELLRMLIMSKIAKDGTKMASVLQVLQLGFLKLTKSIKTTVSGLGLFIKANPILAATTVLAAGLYEVYSHFSEINEELDENKRKYEEAIQPINALTAEYIQLANAIKSAKEAGDTDFDFGENRKGRESIVRKIADELEKENIKIDVSNLSALNDEQLQSKSEELIKRYKGIKKSVQEMSNAYSKLSNEVEGWFGLFGDNIKTDMEDLKRSEADVLSGGASITAQLNLLGANYNELSENAKKYYDTVKGGQNIKAGESEVEYLERVHKAISEIMHLDWGKPVIEELQNMSIKANIDWEAFKTDKKNFLYEVRKMKADFEKQGITDPWNVAVAINTVASENNWSEYEKNIAKREFQVPIVFDQQKIDEQIDTIDQQLKRAFDNKTYNFTIKTNGLDFLSASKEEKKTMDVKLDRLKQLVEERDRSNRATRKLDNYDPIQVNAEINTLRKELTSVGYDLSSIFEKNKNKASKAQRDILSEQISLLKEMQKRYEDLQSVMGKSDAIQSVLQYYSDSLKNVKMPESIVNSFVPTKDGLISALEKLLPTINDFKKKMDVRNTIAELKVQIKKENLKTDLDKVKDEIEKAFNGLQLYKNLKDLGLSDVEISKMFGNITKSFADVRNQIESDFTSKFGADKTKWGKDVADQYVEQMNKLDKQIYEKSVSQFKELTKAYGQQLDERLKIDLWYAEERKKIEENEQLAKKPALKDEYLRNLEKQRAQKSDEADWKQFQNSDFYIRIFENLDSTSTLVLDAMKKKLGELRSSLKNLSPEQLKQVVEAMEKVNNEAISRNPYKNLVKNLKEYLKYQDKSKNLNKEYIESLKKKESIVSRKTGQEEIVERKKEEYEEAAKTYGVESLKAEMAEKAYKTEKEKLDVILKELVDQGKISESLANQIRQGEELKKTFKGQVSEISNQFSQLSSGWGEFESMMQQFGVEFPEEIGGALSGLSQTSGGIKKILDGDIIGGLFSTVSGIGNTIGSIFGFGNNDKKLQSEIEEHQKKIKKLQYAYEDLKDAMDSAWDTSSLVEYTNQSIDALEATNASLKAMINAEKAKKDVDWAQIEEWQRQIEENNKAIKEQQESLIEQLGGFGSESNYKSAAQAFSDDWVDAFNDGSDTLDALNDKMDDYIDNLIKKQLMLRGAKKFLQPVFDTIDKYLTEESDGGVDFTEKELQALKEAKDKGLEQFDEYAKLMMKVMGVSPSGSSTLSQLQQGIQSITESTGQALEGILNSVRFFVQQQTGDISMIRNVINNIYSYMLSSSGVNVVKSQEEEMNYSPIIAVIQEQTNVIKRIDDSIRSVIKLGHPQGGYGMRVFIDGIK